MGFQMVDRDKFKIYDLEARGKAKVEESAKVAEKRQEQAAIRTDGAMDMGSLQERMGRVIKVRVFIAQLKKLNPNLHFELSKGDARKYGIYIPAYKMDFSINSMVRGLRFICGMESGLDLGKAIDDGIMPEFSVLVTDDIIVPDGDSIKKVKKFVREIRGWRTVLAALFLDGHLTDTQIESTFKISQGRDSENWQNRVGKSQAITVG